MDLPVKEEGAPLLHAVSGILPALVTPVDEAGVFQPRPCERLLERVYAAGVDGVYVCGQTGEGLQLAAAQRRRAVECAVANSPRGRQVVVHVGARSTEQAVELARHAAGAGAHAISSLPPAGSYGFEEIREYYREVASAAALPFLVYYYPAAAPAIRSTEQVLELCRLPNVVGLKFTDSDFFRLWALRRSGAVVLNGSDEMLLAGLIMGAGGGIGSTYNVMPGAFVALHKLALAGGWEEARQVQDRINEVISVLLRYPVHPAIKAVLAWSGIDCGRCVPPRRDLTAAEQADLRAGLARTTLGAALLHSGGEA
jgi:N-acetylneuraminate lyase